MPQEESREPVRSLPAGCAGRHCRRHAQSPERRPGSRKARRVHRLRQHSRRPLQPLLLRLRPHLRRKRPKPGTAAATPQSAPQPAPQSEPKAAAKASEKPGAPTHSATTQSPASSAARAKAKASAAAEEPNSSAPAKQPAAALAPETSPTIIGIIPPRKKLMVFRSCRKDLDAYCAGVEYGDGRQLRCLESNKASLSPDCQGALAKLAQ